MFKPSGVDVIPPSPGPSSDRGDAGRDGGGDADSTTRPIATPGSDASAPGGPPARCTSAADCPSGHCADGVCCDRACDGICEACNLAGSEGQCRAVQGDPRPGHGTCAGTGSPCAGTCDGQSRNTCRFPGPETECAPPSCKDATARAASFCSGSGACLPGSVVPCAPFTCDGSICAGGCGPDRPCQPGHHCSGGRCVPLAPNGEACASGGECRSGNCVDGRCCGSASCGSCEACTGAGGTCQKVVGGSDPDSCAGASICGPTGLCQKVDGQACGSAADCRSGFCVGGRCCDSACNDPCHTCAMPGALGICRPAPLANDPDNCGRCGAVCSGHHVSRACSEGVCAGRCEAGWSDCNGDRAGDGCEVATATDPANCGACGVRCPGTQCLGGACERIAFEWSYQGAVAGKSCVRVTELADPHLWHDNYLCTQRDFGLRWSYLGPIDGMVCTQFDEPNDPFAWHNNFLCAPVDYGLRWSNGAPIPNMRCTQIQEPSDPHGWHDNYLCAPM